MCPVQTTGSLAMKVFKQLSPRRIARYIKSFHHGSFMVEALGRFEFQGGVIDVKTLDCRQALSLARHAWLLPASLVLLLVAWPIAGPRCSWSRAGCCSARASATALCEGSQRS